MARPLWPKGFTVFSESLFDFLPQLWERALLMRLPRLPKKRWKTASLGCGPFNHIQIVIVNFLSLCWGCNGLPGFGKTWANCWFNVDVCWVLCWFYNFMCFQERLGGLSTPARRTYRHAQLIKGRSFELQICQLCCYHPTDVCDTGFLQVLILRYPYIVYYCLMGEWQSPLFGESWIAWEKGYDKNRDLTDIIAVCQPFFQLEHGLGPTSDFNNYHWTTGCFTITMLSSKEFAQVV